MPIAPAKESLSIEGPAGRLEVLLEFPGREEPEVVAVVCHPHPQYQGSMENKVVHTVARAMNQLNVAALRFNFRGVGQSEGEYADGVGEVDDALAVMDYAQERWPSAAIWLAGFSFGGVVAARAAAQRPVTQLITIAPAVNLLGTGVRNRPTMPWLIVQGEADDIVPPNVVKDWVAECVGGDASAPVLIMLDDVDHFFHGELVTLRKTIVNYLSKD